MNEHAGQGCILSVVIIVAFTLIFHEVDRPAPSMVAEKSAQLRPTTAPRPGPLEVSPVPASKIPEGHPTVLTGPALPPSILPTPAAAAPPGAQPTVIAASTVSLIGLSRPVAIAPRSVPAGRPTPEPGCQEARAVPSQPVELSPPQPNIPRPRRPISSVTIIQEGERLTDVAARVYGTPDAASLLWQANRDRLRGVDAPVEAGLLIRTP